MKTIGGMFVALAALWTLAFPTVAWSQPNIIFVVCRHYNADKNCYVCSDYFSVRTEEEAQKKCARRNGDPYYFPSVGRVFAWKVSHCTCEEEQD